MPSRSNCRGARSRSLDWPLSRAEKQGHILRLYEADVRAANGELESADRALREKDREIRRLSVGRSSVCSADCSPDAEDDSVDDDPVPFKLDPVKAERPKVRRAEDDTSMESADLLGIETNAEPETVDLLGLGTSSSSQRGVSVQEDSPQPDAPIKCTAGIKIRKDMARSRSLPANRFQNHSDNQRPWWAPAWKAVQRGVQRGANDLKDFSKALIDELVPPSGTEACAGEPGTESSAQRQVEVIEFCVEMDRGDGTDRKRLGLSLSETPPDEPLSVAEVVKGFALHEWNASELPVTVKIIPGGREAVIRRIAVQPGDEISEIDGLEINTGPDDDFRRTIERRMRKCTRLTVRRRIKPRAESNLKGASDAANGRSAAQAGA